jgi:hypothetical protein
MRRANCGLLHLGSFEILIEILAVLRVFLRVNDFRAVFSMQFNEYTEHSSLFFDLGISSSNIVAIERWPVLRHVAILFTYRCGF